MRKFLCGALALGLLVACGEVEDDVVDGPGDGDGDGEEVNPIPEALAVNLNAVEFDPVDEELRLELSALDASPFTAQYQRAPRFDVAGFQAYEVQETPRQRRFIALFRADPDLDVQAGAVADAGQFNRFFGGTHYSRIDAYSQPEEGLATYDGSYAGVLNINPGGASDFPGRSRGNVTLNADFTDLQVNGAIFNRRLLDDGPLNDVILPATDIEDGEFLGTAEFRDLTEIGSYGGIFGGEDASDVAGVLVINPIPQEDLPSGVDANQIFEYGAFIASR